MPAAAPVAVTGEAAVTSARLAAVRREAQTVADLAAAERAAVNQVASAPQAGERLVGGRRFRLESGAWTDAAHTANARIVHLSPFSRAYFDVLTRLPELGPYWSTFEAVTVAGGRVSIRVSPGGGSTLAGAELERLVAEFRAAPAR